jgi:phage shock protein C
MNPTSPEPLTPDNRRALRRPQSGRMLTGVCAGLADFLRVDVTLVRLAVVLLSLLGGGGVLIYLAAWLIIPEEGARQSTAERMLGRTSS